MHWAFESYFLHRIQLFHLHQKPVSLAREKENMTRPVSILLEGLQLNIRKIYHGTYIRWYLTIYCALVNKNQLIKFI